MARFSQTDLQRIGQTTFVRHVDYHDEIASTNSRAVELSADPGIECPALVIAERQTTGRGRGANVWWSAEGGLTFSLVVEAATANLPGVLWPRFSLLAALAVCESLHEMLPQGQFGIKWPNDVFVDSRKLCGILVEAPPVRPEKLVLGIGINVNNSLTGAPGDLKRIAASLVDLWEREFSTADLLVGVLRNLEEGLRQLAANDPKLSERWQQRCLLTGRTVSVDTAGTTITGLCQGMGGDGSLQLQVGDGVEKIYGGVIERIEPPLCVPIVD